MTPLRLPGPSYAPETPPFNSLFSLTGVRTVRHAERQGPASKRGAQLVAHCRAAGPEDNIRISSPSLGQWLKAETVINLAEEPTARAVDAVDEFTPLTLPGEQHE